MEDRKTIGRKSKRKGAMGELEIKNILLRAGYHQARRGQQYCGANGDADVVGLPGIHLEVKRVERFQMWSAMEQAEGDSRDGEVPVVVTRKNRKPWLAVLALDDFLDMYARAYPFAAEESKEGQDEDQN